MGLKIIKVLFLLVAVISLTGMNLWSVNDAKSDKLIIMIMLIISIIAVIIITGEFKIIIIIKS